MRRHALRAVSSVALVGTLLAAALSAGCDGPSPTPPAAKAIALPADLDRLDAQAQEIVRQVHAELSSNPGDAQRWLRMAMALDANEFDDLAAEAYEAALALDDTNARGWYHRFRLQARRGETDAAMASVDRVIDLDDDYGPAHWRRGQLLLDLGRADQAETSFRRALALDGNDPAAWIGLSRALVALERHAEASRILEDRRAGAGLNAGYANLILATAYRRLGRMDEAATALEKAGDAKPVWRDAWGESLDEFRRGYGARIGEARALLEAGRNDEAIAALETLRAEQPENVTVLANLGIALRQKGLLRESVDVLRHSLELDPNHFPSHFQLAVSLAKISRASGVQDAYGIRQEALRHIDRALDLNPSYASGHSLRGDLHHVEGASEEALACYREAERCAPDDPRFPLRTGLTLLRLEQWADAIAPLERSVALRPGDSEAWRALAVARMNDRRFDEAEVALREALLRSPNDPRIKGVIDELRLRRQGKVP